MQYLTALLFSILITIGSCSILIDDVAIVTPPATVSVTPVTVDPTPTQEVLVEARIRLNSATNIRNAPNGDRIRVEPLGAELNAISRDGNWIETELGYVFFGGWVVFIEGSFSGLPESVSNGD